MKNSSKTDIHDDRYATDNEVSNKDSNVIAERQFQPITKITVLIPLHNEQENIKGVLSDVLGALSRGGFEPRVFLIDDGSTDRSLEVIRQMANDDSRVSYISFSRNFGKEVALMAGLRECGDDFEALAYMDSDGQHTSTDLLKLIEAAHDPETDIVCGVRSSREYQTLQQQQMSRIFYGLFRRLSNAQIDKGAGDFNVMKPRVVHALRNLREEHPFMKGLVGWIGFRKKLVPISINPRIGGVAKSSTLKMFKLALGAIFSFSSWPLRVLRTAVQN